MTLLNKVGRPKKVKTVSLKLTETDINTLLDLITSRHHKLIEDGYEDEWAYSYHYEEMGRTFLMGAKLEELRRKLEG